jgi:protection of telomeres protein 1
MALHNPNLHYASPSGLLELPFLNQAFRTRVRVVDFDPPNVIDFAQPVPILKSRHDPMDLDSSPSHPYRWQWLFRLRVEDAMAQPPGQEPARMTLIVSGSEAEFLLDLLPTDLRQDPDKLTRLRGILWTLWGDLEELKQKGQLAVPVEEPESEIQPQDGGSAKQKPSSWPFECCVEEYGKPVDGAIGEYIRCFKIFGTTIQFDESDEEGET